MRSMILVSMMVAAVLGGCGKKKNEYDKLADDATEVVLPNIRASIASGKVYDGIPCSRVTANVDVLEREGYEAVAKDIHQVCDHDLQIAIIKVETEQAEAARKAKPDEKVLRDCFNGHLTGAVDRLARAHRVDDDGRALVARFNKVCPENPIEDRDLAP